MAGFRSVVSIDDLVKAELFAWHLIQESTDPKLACEDTGRASIDQVRATVLSLTEDELPTFVNHIPCKRGTIGPSTITYDTPPGPMCARRR